MSVELEITMYQLFDMFDALGIEYEKEMLLDDGIIEVDSPDGFVPIRGVVRKHVAASEFILTENDQEFASISANKHIVFSPEYKCIHMIDATYVKTKTGKASVDGLRSLGEIDLYDVCLDPPHQYYTANGILHHNTTLAKLLFNELKVNPYDIKEINASKDNGVDYIRDSVVNFTQTMPFGDFKYVLLDEADYLSPNAQAVLRNVMEKYSANVRFILTGNYPNKILPAIHSRCQGFHIDKLDKDEFTVRVANILISEEIEFDMETLDTYVSGSYPDLRKCINLLQQNSYSNKLTLDSDKSSSTSDYRLEMVALFKDGNYKEARQLICTQAGIEEYDDIYRFLYQNVDLFSNNDITKEDKCIIAIRDGLVKHAMVSDVEINLSATITELSMIAQGML